MPPDLRRSRPANEGHALGRWALGRGLPRKGLSRYLELTRYHVVPQKMGPGIVQVPVFDN